VFIFHLAFFAWALGVLQGPGVLIIPGLAPGGLQRCCVGFCHVFSFFCFCAFDKIPVGPGQGLLAFYLKIKYPNAAIKKISKIIIPINFASLIWFPSLLYILINCKTLVK